jgi:hypothetical protein
MVDSLLLYLFEVNTCVSCKQLKGKALALPIFNLDLCR